MSNLYVIQYRSVFFLYGNFSQKIRPEQKREFLYLLCFMNTKKNRAEILHILTALSPRVLRSRPIS